jgi:hypothetical protein
VDVYADKTQKNKSQSFASENFQKRIGSESSFQFVDNRPEAVAQRKLQEIANNNPQAKHVAQLQAMADNYTYGAVQAATVQRQKKDDQSQYVIETYADALRKTNTENVLKDVAEYEGSGKYVFPVCTTDSIYECESGDGLVVPNIEEAEAAEQAFDSEEGGGFFGFDSEMRDNGLSVEDNCKITAEHELVHFWYQYNDLTNGGLGSANPKDWDEINSQNNVIDAMNGLLEDIEAEMDYDSTYQYEYEFLRRRIEYALNQDGDGSTMAETPAVLKEMKSFLEKRLIDIRRQMESMPDEKLTSRLEAVQEKINVLEEKFKRGVLEVD